VSGVTKQGSVNLPALLDAAKSARQDGDVIHLDLDPHKAAKPSSRRTSGATPDTESMDVTIDGRDRISGVRVTASRGSKQLVTNAAYRDVGERQDFTVPPRACVKPRTEIVTDAHALTRSIGLGS
jgi:hypothetical protein